MKNTRPQTILVDVEQPSRARDYEVMELHSRRVVNAFLKAHHYLGKVVGWRFVVGAWHRGSLIGLAVVSRPVARHEDQEHTLEITRLAFAPGAPKNSPSRLIGAVKRKARAEGYERIISYASTGQEHTGSIYLASGFKEVYPNQGTREWNRKNRPRKDRDTSPKIKFEIHL